MVPDKFNMVDMGGIDIIMMQGQEVPGLYQKLMESITQCRYQCLYNWMFDGIIIPPTYVQLEVDENENVSINEGIYVNSNNEIHIYSLEDPAVIEELIVTENGEYSVETGVDGFNPVSVNVNQSVYNETFTENGEYLPDEGYIGFGKVNISVTPLLESKVVHWAGQSIIVTPSEGYDGLLSVRVISEELLSLIPVMTSNSTPLGLASASSILNFYFDAYKAFDGAQAQSSMQGGWLASSADTAPYLSYQFSESKVVDIIRIWTANNSTTTERVVYIEGYSNNEWKNCLESGDHVTLIFYNGTYGESSTLYQFNLDGNSYEAIRIRGTDKFYGGVNQYACTFSEVQVYKYL